MPSPYGTSELQGIAFARFDRSSMPFASMPLDSLRCMPEPIYRALAASLLAAGILAAANGPAQAQGPDAPFFTDTAARSAYVLDVETGSILLEKNGDQGFAPASLAKLMTADIALDALAKGAIEPQTTYPVSDHAWRTGGAPSRTATMFASVRSNVPVDALLKGLAIQGANDAAIILAEGLEGSERAFAEHMNRRATELGLTASHFVNATGLPAEGQAVSARDMALLGRHIVSAYPEQAVLYAEPEFEWNRILQRNRNPLLRLGIGATGLATGFTDGEGYSIVGVIGKDGRQTVLSLFGFESDAARTKETVRLFDWTNANFERRTIFASGQAVGQAQVFGGTAGQVSAVVDGKVELYIPRKRTDLVAATVRYDGPLQAPLRKGDRIGTLNVTIEGKPALQRDVFVGEDVSEGTFAARAAGAIQELAFGWIRSL